MKEEVKQEPGETTPESSPAATALPHLPTETSADICMKEEPEEPMSVDVEKPKTALSILLDSDDDDNDPEITATIPLITSEVRAKLEVDSYLREKQLDSSDDPLEFWAERKHQYPLLSNLARAKLACMGTSVPSERLFSSAGDVVCPTRSLLSPTNVDRLLFLKVNLGDETDVSKHVLSKMM